MEESVITEEVIESEEEEIDETSSQIQFINHQYSFWNESNGKVTSELEFLSFNPNKKKP